METDPRGRTESLRIGSVTGYPDRITVEPASNRSRMEMKRTFDLAEIPVPIFDLLKRLVGAARLPGQSLTGGTVPHVLQNVYKTQK